MKINMHFQLLKLSIFRLMTFQLKKSLKVSEKTFFEAEKRYIHQKEANIKRQVIVVYQNGGIENYSYIHIKCMQDHLKSLF